jgi:hypothetical protein
MKMRTGVLTMALAFAATFAFLTLATTSGAGPALDNDGDGLQNNMDNCLSKANASQHDTDRDGYGNNCDADYDQNGIAGISDFATWSGSFTKAEGDPGYVDATDGTEPPNQITGIDDFATWSSFFTLAPGPSGRGCADATIKINAGDEACPSRARLATQAVVSF